MRDLPLLNGADLVCTLDERHLADRLQEWSAVSERALSRSEEGARIVSTFPPDATVVAELRRLIAAEGECCSFLRFQLTEHEDHVELAFHDPRKDA